MRRPESGAVLGLVIGIAAGYFGRWTDSIAMRIIDVLLAFPGTLLAMVIVAMLGANVTNLILAVGISAVPGFARLVRSQTLSIREADYVLASRSIGCRPWWIIAPHVFPNLRASLIVYATLNVATSILVAAGLGFLGLGSKPPTAEWGLMVADGRENARDRLVGHGFPRPCDPRDDARDLHLRGGSERSPGAQARRVMSPTSNPDPRCADAAA